MGEDNPVDNKVEKIANKIEKMEIRGAADIARAGSRSLKSVAKNYEGSSKKELERNLKESSERILSTRPTAVSLQNAIKFVMDFEADNLEELKERVIQRAERFIERSKIAREKIAEYGAKRINDGDKILTHCNSSLALAAITCAWNEGKEIEIFCTESRPKRQGCISVRELAGDNIPVSMIVDSAVRYHMKDIDKVYVGADTITSNGAVINKIGTSQVALCANEARVPFTVCAETYKFSQSTMVGDLVEIEERDPSEVLDPNKFSEVNVKNPVFDATPRKYVDSIITEEGVIPPGGAIRILKEMKDYE